MCACVRAQARKDECEGGQRREGKTGGASRSGASPASDRPPACQGPAHPKTDAQLPTHSHAAPLAALLHPPAPYASHLRTIQILKTSLMNVAEHYYTRHPSRIMCVFASSLLSGPGARLPLTLFDSSLLVLSPPPLPPSPLPQEHSPGYPLPDAVLCQCAAWRAGGCPR